MAVQQEMANPQERKHLFVGMHRTGLSVVELLVSISIILVLIGILIPAVQVARRAAKDTVCKNNLHQIRLALEQLQGAQKSLPRFPSGPGNVGGWPVAVLPYIDPPMSDLAFPGREIDSFTQPLLRPRSLSCPFGSILLDDDPIASSHYILKISRNRRKWSVVDGPSDNLAIWAVGIEYPLASSFPFDREGPHYNGYYQLWKNGQLEFVPKE